MTKNSSQFGTGLFWGIAIGVAGLYILSSSKGKGLKTALKNLKSNSKDYITPHYPSDPASGLDQLINNQSTPDNKLKDHQLTTARTTLDQLTQRLNNLLSSQEPEAITSSTTIKRFTKYGKSLSK